MVSGGSLGRRLLCSSGTGVPLHAIEDSPQQHPETDGRVQAECEQTHGRSGKEMVHPEVRLIFHPAHEI